MTDRLTVDVHLTDDDWRRALLQTTRRGLTGDPKELPPVWFYDEVGSKLFDEITRLDEYYPTRTERALLVAHAAEIAALARAGTLVELGSGTSDKTRLLLDAMAAAGGLERYAPFDVSEQTVRDAGERLTTAYEDLRVEAVVGDFHRHLPAVPAGGRRLLAFLGGTIGNLDRQERRRFLRAIRTTLTGADHFLLGVDLVKDLDVLVSAYDDDAGVTAAFNRNALVHLNQRLGADFDPDAFEHVARWNPSESWIEMHLRSTARQSVAVQALDLSIEIAPGESVRTEISAKFTPEGITDELGAAGFDVVRRWVGQPGFMLLVARPSIEGAENPD